MLNLHHVVGTGPGMIPPQKLGELMDLIPNCAMVFE